MSLISSDGIACFMTSDEIPCVFLTYRLKNCEKLDDIVSAINKKIEEIPGIYVFARKDEIDKKFPYKPWLIKESNNIREDIIQYIKNSWDSYIIGIHYTHICVMRVLEKSARQQWEIGLISRNPPVCNHPTHHG